MIKLENVTKVFGLGNSGLVDLTLTIEPGEFVFLVGHTGSGKTTLLRLLLRQYIPSKGNISVADIDLVKLPKRKISHYRKKIGVIFQDLKLLSDRTIFENVFLPLEITGVNKHEAHKRVEELLSQVGMIEHKEKFPIQLSGGELQRVAIARALTLSPAILLADEPTGNLDAKTAFEIVELLHQINATGTTIVMATHNLDILKKYPKNRVIGLESGKLILDNKAPKGDKSTKSTVPIIEKGEEIKQVIKESEKNKAPHSSIFGFTTIQMNQQQAKDTKKENDKEQSSKEEKKDKKEKKEEKDEKKEDKK